MFSNTVAVLDASAPALFKPVALTAAPFAGFTLTVICVVSGMFEQCTTMGMGLFCCAESTASGVDSWRLDTVETGTPQK
jgi:hypothetical protein